MGGGLVWRFGRYRKLERVLQELIELLSRAGYGHADYLAGVLEDLRSDPEKALQALSGIKLWGGSGSLFDLIMYPLKGHEQEDWRSNTRQKYALLCRLLIELHGLGHGPQGRYYEELLDALRQLSREDIW